ncbi:DUF2231 domain-containing protein [Neobacillus sp. SM06]|uniref:DUF2231 domain-containing protein n=1 Tax=Neobacillus sp. SM06 TaxID=3422492 RepID=UPI003D293507
MFQEVFSHIHPIMVHFPIVLILFATIYDVFSLITKRKISPRKGFWLWLIAFLSAWIAVGTGPEHDARGNTNVFEYHQDLADLTTLIAFLVVAFRAFFVLKKKELIRVSLAAYLVLSLLSTVGILSTGYFGGKMVYSQGVGVKMNGTYVNPPKSGKWNQGN